MTRIAYIRWFDSCISGPEAMNPEDACTLHENESAGILIEDGEHQVTIALDRDENNQNVRCTLCIPKVNIRRITLFTSS